jgi:hypothetical protein
MRKPITQNRSILIYPSRHRQRLPPEKLPQSFCHNGNLPVPRLPHHSVNRASHPAPDGPCARTPQEDLCDILLAREVYNGAGYVRTFQDVRFDVQVAREA